LDASYSEWLRLVNVLGLKSGSPPNCEMRGYQIGVAGLFRGVLQKFIGGRLGVNSLGGVVMALVTKHAHQFRRQSLVENVKYSF